MVFPPYWFLFFSVFTSHLGSQVGEIFIGAVSDIMRRYNLTATPQILGHLESFHWLFGNDPWAFRYRSCIVDIFVSLDGSTALRFDLLWGSFFCNAACCKDKFPWWGSCVFRNRNVPSTLGGQPKAIVIDCNILGVTWKTLTNNSCLVFHFFEKVFGS